MLGLAIAIKTWDLGPHVKWLLINVVSIRW